MNLEDRLNASLAARAFLERATAEAHGWDVSDSSSNSLAVDHLYLYCFDMESFFTWMSCVEFDSFKEVASDINETPSLWTAAINDLDACINSMALARRFHEAFDPPSVQAGAVFEPEGDELALPELIADFAGTTRIAFDASLLVPACHFIVTRYTNEIEGNIFRPLVLPPSITKTTSVLEMGQLHDYIAQMMLVDRIEHPDWFL